jgi:hypothetical protein
MDPVIIIPAGALLLAWAATRKKKKVTKKSELPSELDELDKPLPPPPTGPYVGPGGEEPWRPGGPGQGPKPFPGPSGGPKHAEDEDPSPIEIWPGTRPEDIEAHPHARYGLFVSADCETVYVGELWYEEVFLPQARELVLGYTKAFHHPSAVMYELLVARPSGNGFFSPNPVMQREHYPEDPHLMCIAAFGDFVYGDFTPVGTYSGWVTHEDAWDYYKWFRGEYPVLSGFLSDLSARLWSEVEFAWIFELEWPEDEPDGDLDFDY